MSSTPHTLPSTNKTCGYSQVSCNGMELGLILPRYNAKSLHLCAILKIWHPWKYFQICSPKACVFWHGGHGFKTNRIICLMLSLVSKYKKHFIFWVMRSCKPTISFGKWIYNVKFGKPNLSLASCKQTISFWKMALSTFWTMIFSFERQ